MAGNRSQGALRIDVTAPDGKVRRGFRILDNAGDQLWSGNRNSGLISFTRIRGAEVRGNAAYLDPMRTLWSVSLNASCSAVGDNVFDGAAGSVRTLNPVSCP